MFDRCLLPVYLFAEVRWMLGDFSAVGLAAKRLPTSRAGAWAGSAEASAAIWDSSTPGDSTGNQDAEDFTK